MRSRFLPGLFAALACLPAFGQDLEAIDPSYRNVRGINYLATYPSLNGTLGYCGVASSTAMWYYYDTSPGGTWTEVDEQLGWLRKAGINTIRVFLSFPVWEYYENNPQLNQISDKNDAVRRYEHFLGLCEENGIWCSPVLWDETLALAAPEPVPGTVFGNLCGWHTNPGESRMQAFLDQDPTLVSTLAGSYVSDYVAASPPGSAFLFWHLMNEPAAPDPLAASFLSATLGILHGAAPSQPTLLLGVWAAPNTMVSQLALDPRVDLLGIHPYGVTRGAIEAQVYDALHIPDAGQPSGYVRKPIIATEIGSPGTFGAYQDAVNYALGVGRPDLGATETGVGYMPWVSNIGWKGGSYPFKKETGLFYGDGEVRERDAVMAFVAAAIAQNVGQDTLFLPGQLIEKTATSDPTNYIAQGPLPVDLDSYADLVTYVTADPTTMSWNELGRTMLKLISSGHCVSYLASTTNGNPYGIVGVPYRADESTRFLLQEFLPDPDLWTAVQAAAVQACGGTGPFDPDDPCHFYFFASQLVAPWQALLAPYAIGQGGPY